MKRSQTILVHEYGRLVVGETYGGVKFEHSHLLSLGQYITRHPDVRFYTLYLNYIAFNQFVGVIRVGELTIEVLPKTDNHQLETESWQKILFKMLMVSLQVDAKITTPADVNLGTQSVLEAYIQLFIDEVAKLIHEGLVKKYRSTISNQYALKGKLLIHHNVAKNATHAERFYVAHQVYDRDNIFNSILYQALTCLEDLKLSGYLRMRLTSCRLDFPDCSQVQINQDLFSNLSFDRKTERYRPAITLARIILMNFHPDVRSGKNNILAIMFDMNALWETYVYAVLRRA
jgi:5-methylcytosine-specific restriction enzyme subunit McrC